MPRSRLRRAGEGEGRCAAGGPNPEPLLAERSIFRDLVDDAAFVADLGAAMAALERDGVRVTLRGLLPVQEVR